MIDEREQYVSMPDGVRLDVSACTPAGAAAADGLPAVVVVHGHGDNSSKAGTVGRARQLAERGYVAVTYSVRGQGASEGLSHTLSVQELYDLQEIITWTLGQPPVDRGKLAVMGGSQGGWHAYMAAAHDPRVACVIAENAPSDLAQMALPNGCMGRWWYNMTMRRKILTAGYPDVIRRWTAEDRWDLVREWTNVRSPLFRAHAIRCPVMILQGMYDEPLPGNQALAIWDRIDAPKRMFLGVGGHNHPPTDEETALRRGLEDQWLDHWLKGEDNDWSKSPPVLYLVGNTREQRYADTFPPPGSSNQEWYLHADGVLSLQPPEGVEPPSSVRNRSADSGYNLRSALRDDFARAERTILRDTVAFESGPLDMDVEVVGTPSFRLQVASDGPWFQLNLTLHDVAPDGDGSYITRGNIGSRRAEPGRTAQVEFDGVTTAYQVKRGHRLRLEVSNTSYPVIVPYFEEFLCRLFHDGKLRSLMRLPILPA